MRPIRPPLRRRAAFVAALLASALAFSAPLVTPSLVATARAEQKAEIKVPFEKYTLPNGLTVILHEDHALPLVTVNTMVKVGSRFEEPKRTGFAHLFEHLMFMGTRRAPPKMFDTWMESEGGWNNAWTSEDRTDYFDVGPAHTLKLLLWLEADRFSSLADEMTKDKLDVQREVVRNERRQRTENEPYGKVELRLPELLFPPGHPYHHPVIGSHEDLQAATVDDVKGFFKRWYVPNNAALVVAGDFSSAEVKPLIEKWFGAIPSSPVPAAPAAKPVKLDKVVRESLTDKVELGKVVMAWHSPARYAPGDAELDLLSVILTDGKASRLYKALVYDKAIAQEVSAYQASADLGSYFLVEAIARPGVTLAQLEAAIDEEIKKITNEAVSGAEITRAKNQFETSFVSRLQSVTARASMLAQYETYVGDPGYAEKDLARYRAVTPEALQRTAKSTLDTNARVIIHVEPEKKTNGAGGAP
ncbi:M16 family metallopeptidase [Polyangium spumosum]|uniref:Insulinase family protein n=1 Tax=Polyangium spumosum TaxID=889282 RepID=A0A6N7PI29_9BACT|nr:pitrilysin family protein [Polyangium spumosum]MRG91628.1 insulinase family protein [Polyangium spumosum]